MPATPESTIWISLDGATPAQIERCRQIIHLMFDKGVFNIQNGSAELHFDNEGTLQMIRTQVDAYRRNRTPAPLPKVFEYVNIQSLDSSTTRTFSK